MKKTFNRITSLLICFSLLNLQVMASEIEKKEVSTAEINAISEDEIITRNVNEYTYEYHFSNNNLETSFLTITNNLTQERTNLVRNGNTVYLNEGLDMVVIATAKETNVGPNSKASGSWTGNIYKDYEIDLSPLESFSSYLVVGILMMYNPFVSWTGVFGGAIGAYCQASGDVTVSVELIYKEYVGCPQYKNYLKQIAYRENGTQLKAVSTDDYVFTGVHNSPENPPTCRELGF